MSVGLTVEHRRYVPYSHAHYGGNLVDGAYVLGLFGDVATEVCIQLDGDEGLFASYSDVQFRAPVIAGDVLVVTATVTAIGRRSRRLEFSAQVVCRADPARGPSAASVLLEPVVAVTATGTVVVPAAGLAPGQGAGPRVQEIEQPLDGGLGSGDQELGRPCGQQVVCPAENGRAGAVHVGESGQVDRQRPRARAHCCADGVLEEILAGYVKFAA